MRIRNAVGSVIAIAVATGALVGVLLTRAVSAQPHPGEWPAPAWQAHDWQDGAWQAWGPGRPMRPGRAWQLRGPAMMRRQLLRGINLDESQRARVRELMSQQTEQFRTLSQKIREARRGLAEATTAETLNEALVRERSAAVSVAQADLAVARAKMRAQLLAVLTPEQQAVVKERQARMKEQLQRQRQQLQQRLQRIQQQLQKKDVS
jgi:Spy/CpxP family protein refolding chaperone